MLLVNLRKVMLRRGVVANALISILFLSNCEKSDGDFSRQILFAGPGKANVVGYDGDVMEPFISRDGAVLLFNNSNQAINTNLHWAVRLNDSTFDYKGEISGLNTLSLDGVPTMDIKGQMYFVSLRVYDQTQESIYVCDFANGEVANISQVPQLSRKQAGWVNFDVEVDSAGEYLYFVDGRFDVAGGPYEADIFVARNIDGIFEQHPESAELMQNINTADLEYAASISADGLELYFTRVTAPLTSSSIPQIFVATRELLTEPFRKPQRMANLEGFVEAPSIGIGGRLLYYHKKELDGKFNLYFAKRSR